MRLCERRERRRKRRGGILSWRALCVYADPRYIDCGWKLCFCVTAGDYTRRHNRATVVRRGGRGKMGRWSLGQKRGNDDDDYDNDGKIFFSHFVDT